MPPSPNTDPGAWVQHFLSFFGFRRDLGTLSASPEPKFFFNNHGNMTLDAIIAIVVQHAAIDDVTVTPDKAGEVAMALVGLGPSERTARAAGTTAHHQYPGDAVARADR
jgi:hypothetical protein